MATTFELEDGIDVQHVLRGIVKQGFVVHHEYLEDDKGVVLIDTHKISRPAVPNETQIAAAAENMADDALEVATP